MESPEMQIDEENYSDEIFEIDAPGTSSSSSPNFSFTGGFSEKSFMTQRATATNVKFAK
jgi:hypothetical protein